LPPQFFYDAVARLLLEKGADVEATDEEGWVALHIAALNGQLAAVELLLKKGADIEATDLDGWTALHFAASNGQ
jgi:ankyrin repeat protein